MGVKHTVTFEKRDFSGPQPAPGLVLEVERMYWRAVGGPWKAQLTARASAQQEVAGAARLWQAAELLRCGVKIFDELGAAWWGYVSSVTLHWENASARVSTDELANDVMVRYQNLSPDPWGGEDVWTAAAVDTASVAKYGRRQQVFELGPATAAQAEAFRAAQLARYAWPGFDAGPLKERSGSTMYAVIECRGYWETLDWLFYKDSRGAVGNTAAGTGLKLFETGSSRALAQSITNGAEAWTVTEVWLRADKYGMPADGMFVHFRVNASGLPGATWLAACATKPAAEVPNERGWLRFVLDVPFLFTPSMVCWLTVTRTGATDAANYYNVGADMALGYLGGALKYFNGTAWVDNVPNADMGFMLRGVVSQDAILLRMLEQSGQFFAGVRMEAALGFDGVPYRDGRQRGRAEVEAVLRQGTSTGGRVLARVEADRWLRVYAQPGSALPELQIGAGGVLCWRDGRRLHSSELAAGRWASLGLQAGAIVRAGAAGENAAAFVEGCAWSKDTGLRLTEE